MPLSGYNAGELVPEGLTEWVRDLLGVDAETLPDSFLLGLPAAKLRQAANRRVPTWATLAQSARGDFDIACALFLAVESINRLRTLYAPGEGTGDVKGGQYDWLKRKGELMNDAQAAWNRAAEAANTTAVTTTYRPFQPYGRSRRDGYVSPDPFNPSAGPLFDPYGELRSPVV